MPNTFMPEVKTEANFTLKSGVKVRFFRREPFKFMGDIEKWMNDLNIGEPLAFEMNTDANGWVNLAVAYREHKESPIPVIDPQLVMLDIVSVLKDVVDALDAKMLKAPAPTPAVTHKQESPGAD